MAALVANAWRGKIGLIVTDRNINSEKTLKRDPNISINKFFSPDVIQNRHVLEKDSVLPGATKVAMGHTKEAGGGGKPVYITVVLLDDNDYIVGWATYDWEAQPGKCVIITPQGTSTDAKDAKENCFVGTNGIDYKKFLYEPKEPCITICNYKKKPNMMTN